MRLALAYGILAFLTSLAVAPPIRAQDGEGDRLLAYFRCYLDATFEARPLFATRLGDHRFDDRLDDLTAEARAANLERDRRTLDELPEHVDYDALTRASQVDYEIFQHHLRREIWLAENFDPFVEDPRVYGEYATESIYLLLTQSTLPKVENLANVVSRMAEIPGILEVAQRTIGTPPRPHTETAIAQARGAIGFYREDLFLLAGQEPGEGQLGERAEAIVEALHSYVAFLEGEVLPRADDDWRIGPEKFARKLELELDAGLSAEEVLAEAEAEASRVEQAMYVIAKQLWGRTFPGEPLPPDDEPGRREAIRRVLAETSKHHSTPESLVDDVRSTVEDIKAFIADRGILGLPEPDQCRIIEMPEFLRGNSTAYLNPVPPLDVKGSSEYAISPPPSDWDAERVESYFREYNAAMLQILTIHEAYPGHYVQLEYSNRTPSLIRRVLQSGTFAEGWAVYTEQMMLDQGYGDGDPVLRLNQLKFYLRAVLNAILDQKMHVEEMTDEEALELLVGRGFQTEGEAVGKIIRSKQSSVQLSTYFVGRTAFDRLRRAIQREQGEDFRLGPYHEAVLSQGTIPVRYLPELVRTALDPEG